MELFITHKSALEYWRLHGMTQIDRNHRHRRKNAPAEIPRFKELKLRDVRGLTYPLEITVRARESIKKSKMIRAHVFSRDLPEGSIIDVGNGLYVASPELCYYQVTGKLSLPRILQLALEFCGSYSLPANNTVRSDPSFMDKGFIERPALTSKEKLTAFYSQMRNSINQRQTSRSLRFISNGSASPMETALTILLTLPYHYGGYGFDLPELNTPITPVKAALQNSSKSYYRCDLYWRKLRLAMEYDSDRFHSGSEQIARDSMKRNSLQAMGVTVITVTKQQVNSTFEFERIARQLAVHFGRRLMHSNANNFYKAHRRLRNLLEIRDGDEYWA